MLSSESLSLSLTLAIVSLVSSLSRYSCISEFSFSRIHPTDPALQDWCGLRGLPLTCLWLGGKSGGNERELLGIGAKMDRRATQRPAAAVQLTTEACPF